MSDTPKYTANPVGDGIAHSNEPCLECGHPASMHEHSLALADPGCSWSGGMGQCKCLGWKVEEPEVDEKVEEAIAYLNALGLDARQKGNLAGQLMGEAASDLIKKFIGSESPPTN